MRYPETVRAFFGIPPCPVGLIWEKSGMDGVTAKYIQKRLAFPWDRSSVSFDSHEMLICRGIQEMLAHHGPDHERSKGVFLTYVEFSPSFCRSV